MKRVDITLGIPIDDEATQEDADALGQMVARLALADDDATGFDIKPTGALIHVELLDDVNRLGIAGAAALRRQIREGERS